MSLRAILLAADMPLRWRHAAITALLCFAYCCYCLAISLARHFHDAMLLLLYCRFFAIYFHFSPFLPPPFAKCCFAAIFADAFLSRCRCFRRLDAAAFAIFDAVSFSMLMIIDFLIAMIFVTPTPRERCRRHVTRYGTIFISPLMLLPLFASFSTFSPHYFRR